MAEASNTLDKARSLIEERLKEINDERARLERALADLKGTRRGPGRPRGASGNGRRRRSGTGSGSGSGSGARSTAPKRRRRRRGGTRAEQALKHISANPGIRASEIASKMKIKPNYVYRVMSELQEDGKVTKKGRGYTAADATTTGAGSSAS